MAYFAPVFIGIFAAIGLIIIYRSLAEQPIGFRYSEGKPQTAVVFYENQKTRVKAIFVATSHIGEREYYKSLKNIIDSHSALGYRVFYERSIDLTSEQKRALTKEELDLVDWYYNYSKHLKEDADMKHLQEQNAGLPDLPSWQNADMSLYQIVKLMAREKIKPRKIYYSLQDLTKPKAVQRIIVDERNRMAFRKMKNSLKKENVIIIYGAGHFPGIHKKLKRAGFKEYKKEWFAADNLS